MSFRLDDIPSRQLPNFIRFVDHHTDLNSKNKDHINWMEALVKKLIFNFFRDVKVILMGLMELMVLMVLVFKIKTQRKLMNKMCT